MNNVTHAAAPRQPLNDRVLATGVIRRTPAPLPPATLAPIIAEHQRALSSNNGHDADLAFEVLGVDVDEGTSVSIEHASALAITVTALAATIARMRADMVKLEDVPVQSLRAVMAEVSDGCAECGAAPCHCWAFDETLEAPVDVHPAYRAQEAAAIRRAVERNSAQRAAS